MEIPRTVYHGTFWPEGENLNSERLSGNVGYLSTSSSYDWARYFGVCKRCDHRERAGLLTVYEIDTGLLPEDVISGCIPPDDIDPRALTRDWLRKLEDGMKPERIKIGEWRFPYIPLSAIVLTDEQHFNANPAMSIFDVAICMPR